MISKKTKPCEWRKLIEMTKQAAYFIIKITLDTRNFQVLFGGLAEKSLQNLLQIVFFFRNYRVEITP